MANELFDRCDDISKSLGYMICTRYVSSQYTWDEYKGAMHLDIDEGRFTARPQLVSQQRDPFLHFIIKNSPTMMLVNTSFNFHGEPIIFTAEQAIETHKRHLDRAKQNLEKDIKFITVIVK